MSSPFEGPYSKDNGECPNGHPTNAFGRCSVLNATGKCDPPTAPFVESEGYVCLNCMAAIGRTPTDIQDHLARKHVVIRGWVVNLNE